MGVSMVLLKIRNAILFILIIFLFLGFTDFNINELFSNELSNPYVLKSKELEKDEVIISRVVDGDTIHVINHEGREEKVRLLLIDTPESVHPNKQPEKFGQEASDFVKGYLKQGIKVELERGNPAKDKYGRTLGYIFVDGVNFNELMVSKGYARVAYVFEPNTKYLSDLKKAEKRARDRGLNIWSIDGYVTENGFDMSAVK